MPTCIPDNEILYRRAQPDIVTSVFEYAVLVCTIQIKSYNATPVTVTAVTLCMKFYEREIETEAHF